MYTNKEREELANICYMHIERECAKPLKRINTDLVNSCIELANLLLDIKPLNQDEISSAKHKIEMMTLRRRKTLKVHIIAAVVAVLLLLGTTVYAFSDWLSEVFGIETLQTIQPGDKVTVDQHELEAPSGIIYFSTIEELTNYIDQPIYLPIKLPEGYEVTEIIVFNYADKRIDLTLQKETQVISITISITPAYFNENQFNSYEYDFYSPDGFPFDFIHIDMNWQAIGWIDNNEYTILAQDVESLKIIIDSISKAG